MDIKKFAIVKLKKEVYNSHNTDFKCDLLVIKINYKELGSKEQSSYVVRYPNGATQLVYPEDISWGYVSELSSSTYVRRHKNNPVVMWELEHNPKYKELLQRYLPDSPLLVAKPKDIEKYEETPPCTTPISVPELPEPIAEEVALTIEPITLESLDKKIQIILDYIKAGENGVQS